MDNDTPNKPHFFNFGKDRERTLLLIGIAVIIVVVCVLLVILLRGAPTKQTSTPTFPVSGNVTNIENGNGNGNGGNSMNATSSLVRLVELYKGPVAGYALQGDGLTIRLFDRDKGRLVDVDSTNGNSTIVSDQPILGVHDAAFLANDRLILRTLGDGNVIKSTLYTITETGSKDAPLSLVEPTALADDVLELAASPDATKAVLVIRDPKGANIDVLDTATKKLSRQITLPISEWIPTITNDGEVYLSAKASFRAKSGTYLIEKGKLRVAVPAHIAQTSILSPDGSMAYNMFNDGTSYQTSLTPTDPFTGGDTPIIDITTIAEKCAWTSGGEVLYCGEPLALGNTAPDDWYLGAMTYQDSIKRYDTRTGTLDVVIVPKSLGSTIDVTLMVAAARDLFFVNKIDGHLWMYRLTDDERVDATTSTSTATSTNVH